MNTNNNQRRRTRQETIEIVKSKLYERRQRGDTAQLDTCISNCIICKKAGFLCCNSIHYCSKEHQKEDWKLHKAICLKRKPVLVMNDVADALDDVAENKKVILSMSMVHEVLEYIHKDFRYILHRNDDGRVKDKLSIDIILKSHMQDYFAGVLLSSNFRANVCDLAIQAGSLHSVQWAKRHHCSLGYSSILYAGAFGNIGICKFILDSVKMEPKKIYFMLLISEASTAGHVDVIKYFHEQNFELHFEVICSAAAYAGAINIIQYAVSIGKNFDSRVYHGAARGGYIDILDFAFSIGCCELDKLTCSSAAGTNQLQALKWARSHGCQWDQTCCFEALVGILRDGNGTETLNYLIENQCPMEGVVLCRREQGDQEAKHFNLIDWSFTENKFRIAKHALDYGCPCENEFLRNFLMTLPEDDDDDDDDDVAASDDDVDTFEFDINSEVY